MIQVADGHVPIAVIRSIWLLLQKCKDKSSGRVRDPFGMVESAGISIDTFLSACLLLSSSGYIRYGTYRAGGKTLLYISLLKEDLGPDILQDWEPQSAFPDQGNGHRNTYRATGLLEEEEDGGVGLDVPEDKIGTARSTQDNASQDAERPERRKRESGQSLEAGALKIFWDHAQWDEKTSEWVVHRPNRELKDGGISQGSTNHAMFRLVSAQEIHKITSQHGQRVLIDAVVMLKPRPDA